MSFLKTILSGSKSTSDGDDGFEKAMLNQSKKQAIKKQFIDGSITRLPQEVLAIIFLFLDAQTLAKIASVAKLWNTLSSHNSLWIKHAQARGLFFSANAKESENIKNSVIADMKDDIKKNIYFLGVRAEEKDPYMDTYTILTSDHVLDTQLKTCWSRLRGWTMYNPGPDEKNIVYKLFISDEQIEKMQLQLATFTGTSSSPAYCVLEAPPFSLKVLEVSYQPVIGGKFQRVAVKELESPKLEPSQDKKKTTCAIS